MNMKADLNTITMWLVVIGAINWGLAPMGYDLVDMLLGSIPMLASLVYYLVGLSGLYVGYNMVSGK